jgi:hypothetical protein
MKDSYLSSRRALPRGMAVLAAALCSSVSLLAIPIITSVVERNGDNEATDTVTAKYTGITFWAGVAGEPVPGTSASNPYTVPLFGEGVPAFVDRVHHYSAGTTTLPIPSYLAGGEYIMSGNDNRDNNTYQLDITVSQGVDVYFLVDDRMGDSSNANPPNFGATPTRDANMGWLLLDGWVGVTNGLNRFGNMNVPDQVGIDEDNDGAGPGVGINQWFSIFVKRFTNPGMFTVYQANNSGQNMYGIVIVPIPYTPKVVGSTGNLLGFSFQIKDGETSALDPNSLEVRLDSQIVTPQTVNKVGQVTTVAYATPTNMPSLSQHTASIAYSDNGSPVTRATNSFTFTVEYYGVLTPDLAVNAADLDLTKPGFVARVSQWYDNAQWPGPDLPTTIQRAEDQLAGRLREPATGLTMTNLADPFDANPDGTYSIPGGPFAEYINWNQDFGPGGPANPVETGSFTTANGGTPDYGIPGIPGRDPTVILPAVNVDNVAAEVVTYLELKKGVYRFGVNSDDGFKVTAGRKNPRDASGLLLGQFDGGRGVADSLFYVDVLADGYYPVRLLWYEGGGGAALEFFTVDLATGQKSLINNSADPKALKAYGTPKVKRPGASIYPTAGAQNVPASATVQLQVVDDGASVNQGTVAMTFNGTAVTPSITKAGAITTIAYKPTDSYLPPGTNAATVIYSDTATPSASVTNTWQFVVHNWTTFPMIPASFAVPASAIDMNSSGFSVDCYSMTNITRGNNVAETERQLARGYIDPATSQPYPNLFSQGTLPGGRHLVPMINWNQTAPANANDFNGGNNNFDTLFPGQPASGDYNYIAAEAIAYVELKKGLYQFGNNNDDGFRLTTAANPKDLNFALQLGIDAANPALYWFFVEADGIYPMRLIYWEGTGGATHEHFVVEPFSGARRLINDRGNAAYFGVNTYAVYTGAERPYLLTATPGQNAVGQFPDVTVQAVITNYTGTDVKLRLNSTEVTPTVTAGVNSVTVRYTPTTLLASGSTNTVAVEYGGLTTAWSFTVHTYTDLPPSLALPVSAADPNAVGFWAKVVKAPDSVGTLANSTARAEAQLAGTLTNTATGQPYVNEVPAGPGPNGTYLVPGFVNWNLLTNQQGNFQAPTFADQPVPGIAQLGQNFNVAAEVVAWLELPAGLIKMGVNSDDGFRVTVATNADPAAIQVGVFEGNRGSADTWFSFITPQAGLYPLRLIYYQGNGGGNVELFSFDAAGNRVLVNDRANPGAVKAYWQVTGQAPAPSITDVSVAGGNVTIKWTGGGTLEWTAEFPTTGNPTWTSTTDSDGEFTETAGAEKRFYRVKR